jgi:hypothetical protein
MSSAHRFLAHALRAPTIVERSFGFVRFRSLIVLILPTLMIASNPPPSRKTLRSWAQLPSSPAHDDMTLFPARGHNQHAAVVEFDTQTPVLKAIPEAGDSPAFYTF